MKRLMFFYAFAWTAERRQTTTWSCANIMDELIHNQTKSPRNEYVTFRMQHGSQCMSSKVHHWNSTSTTAWGTQHRTACYSHNSRAFKCTSNETAKDNWGWKKCLKKTHVHTKRRKYMYVRPINNRTVRIQYMCLCHQQIDWEVCVPVLSSIS